ncbi:MAG: transcriptional repressor LexA, partial [Planctomycetales bacterium]|nr:transcriptional repressor LexA [Planctomycetales bacterium]
PLTNQQQAVYNLIRERIIHRGYGPTVREIGEHMNIKSPNGVMCHLRALERKGMILRASNKSRAIELTESLASLVGATLKIQGSITDSVCTLLGENCQHVDLADLTEQGSSFLRVSDDSLIDAQIRSGDLLVLHQQSQAQSGQLTLVRSAELGTCIRYWFPGKDQDQGQVRLQPVPLAQAATTVAHAEVLGVIVGVVRMIQPLVVQADSLPGPPS